MTLKKNTILSPLENGTLHLRCRFHERIFVKEFLFIRHQYSIELVEITHFSSEKIFFCVIHETCQNQSITSSHNLSTLYREFEKFILHRSFHLYNYNSLPVQSLNWLIFELCIHLFHHDDDETLSFTYLRRKNVSSFHQIPAWS